MTRYQPALMRIEPWAPFGARQLGQEAAPNGAAPENQAPAAVPVPVNRYLLLGGGAFLTLAGGGQLLFMKKREVVPVALAATQTLIGLLFVFQGMK